MLQRQGRKSSTVFFLVILLIHGIISCASGPKEIAGPNFGDTRAPESEESVVIVNWLENKYDKNDPSARMIILLDGEEKLILTNDTQGKIIVPKGRHTIQAVFRSSLFKKGMKGATYSFTVAASQITFDVDGIILSIGK
jgi:hypothetical protein